MRKGCDPLKPGLAPSGTREIRDHHPEGVTNFNKQSVVRDLTALFDSAKGFPDLAKKQAAAILAEIAKLEADPALLAALQRRTFIEKGLDLVDGPACPLCDTPWTDEQHLREHLKAKLTKSEEARKIQQVLLNNGAGISQEIIRITGYLTPVQKLADTQGDAPFAALVIY
jgi:DNA repair exonuclease SbcCD ATPase subunit